MTDPVAHPLHRLSAIARPVEPRYPTNLAVLIIMGLAGVGLSVTAVVRGAAMLDALLAGVIGAVVVFVTWALTRDLAPDDDPAAFAALVPVSVMVLGGANPVLLGPMVALGLVRVVNRSVGPAALLVDRVVLTVLVFVLAREGHGFSVGVAAVVAFALDAVLPERHPNGWKFAGLAAAATGMGMLIGEPQLSIVAPGPWTFGAMATAAVYVLIIATQGTPISPCDADPDRALRRDRVQGGMLVGLLAGAGSLLGGDEAVQAWAMMWAAYAGVSMTRPLLRWRAGRS